MLSHQQKLLRDNAVGRCRLIRNYRGPVLGAVLIQVSDILVVDV